jgi:hypothetical protein
MAATSTRLPFVCSWGDGMSTSVERVRVVAADVLSTSDTLSVALSDGRTVTAPLTWFPRLLEASPRQRGRWELIGGGIGMHWPAVDEDVSVASLLQPENFIRLPDTALPAPIR